jgi:NAD(P)-dependent dehydrogenase (short-subunit alcohol dehydrogenase family)
MPDASILSRLDGKVAIVTGGAQGIGEATARRLVELGAHVTLLDTNAEGVEAVASQLGGASIAFGLKADVTHPDDIADAVARTMDRWGRIDILVNNASNVARIGQADGDIVSTSLDIWDEVYACNLRGPAAACKFAIPHMIAGGGGAIVNIASVQALAGEFSRTAYGSAKAGLIAMTKYVATGFGRQGIRCNSVAPGLVLGASAEAGRGAFHDMIARHMPLAETGRPADLAEVIVFLTSDAARYVTGENIVVDGGLTAHLPFYADHREIMLSTGG